MLRTIQWEHLEDFKRVVLFSFSCGGIFQVFNFELQYNVPGNLQVFLDCLNNSGAILEMHCAPSECEILLYAWVDMELRIVLPGELLGELSFTLEFQLNP